MTTQERARLLARLEARSRRLFQREPRSAALAVGAPSQPDVEAVGAILVAAMHTAQHVDILVAVCAGATVVWSSLLLYPPEREREQHGLLRRLYRELERRRIDPWEDKDEGDDLE